MLMIAMAAEAAPMIAFTLLSAPESVGKARVHVRAALEHQGLEIYADNAETVTSELVTNSVQHVGVGIADKISVVLLRVQNPAAVAIVVKDASPVPPAIRELTSGSEAGRGLRIVEALSAQWAWQREGTGKAVTAILAMEGEAE